MPQPTDEKIRVADRAEALDEIVARCLRLIDRCEELDRTAPAGIGTLTTSEVRRYLTDSTADTETNYRRRHVTGSPA